MPASDHQGIASIGSSDMLAHSRSNTLSQTSSLDWSSPLCWTSPFDSEAHGMLSIAVSIIVTIKLKIVLR